MATPRIHPTAVIADEAELAADVRIGPFAVIEGLVRVGPGCVIQSRAHLIGPLEMGQENHLWPNVVLGGAPQHAGYKGEPTRVEIGDRNIFREGVTVHRGTTASMVTRIGNDNVFMVGSHVGHDVVVGNNCTLVNYALLGGHSMLEDGVIISGGAMVHQFCRVGRLAFLSGLSGTSKDMPPFILQQGINWVSGLNLVGLRRAKMTAEQINALRRLYHIMYLQGLSVPNAIALAETELGEVDVVKEFLRFVRNAKRGINGASKDAEPLAA